MRDWCDESERVVGIFGWWVAVQQRLFWHGYGNVRHWHDCRLEILVFRNLGFFRGSKLEVKAEEDERGKKIEKPEISMR